MTPFKGFNIVYPSYTVVCPQTGLSFDVRSLNVSEVGKLKASLVTPNKATELVNRSLWESLNSKPSFVKTFEEFKKNVTLKDREALLYGLHQATFGDDKELSVTCRYCEHEQVINVLMSKCFSFNAYPGSESIINSYKVTKAIDNENYDPEVERKIKENELANQRKEIKSITPPLGMPKEIAALEFGDDNDGIIVGKKDEIKYVEEDKPKQEVKREETKLVNPNQPASSIINRKLIVELPISKVVAILRQPTIWDEEMVFNSLSFSQKKQNDILYETLIIEKFEQYEPGSKKILVSVTNREDILYGYQSLPPKDKKKMTQEFQNNFGEYGIDLKTNYNCSNCSERNEIDLDIIIQFFRAISTS